ncbi:MAG TPA: universal stress protein [Puia sp.]|nr:universal stress protein [Puia sp.]
MTSILVPVNFSPCSFNAAHYAAGLAKATGAELHLLHVIQIPLPSTEMVMNEYLYRQMSEAAENGLKEMKTAILEQGPGLVSVTTHLHTGDVAEKVQEWFAALNAELIVLGVTAPTMEKFLAGSPVGALLHLRHPLLVVPEHAKYETLRRIVLACDENDVRHGIPHSLPLLRELRERMGATIDIVTVDTGGTLSDEASCYCGAGADSLAVLSPKRHYVRQHNVEEGLQEYLHDEAFDLTVVFPKRHSLLEFHPSRSRRLARHAQTPVLSLPE